MPAGFPITTAGFIVNPTYAEIADGQLNMVVASTRDAIMMVEAGSYEVSEEVILEGIQKAFNANLIAIDQIDELVAQVGKEKLEVAPDTEEAEQLDARIKTILNGRVGDILEQNAFKSERDEGLDRLEDEVAEQLAEEFSPRSSPATGSPRVSRTWSRAKSGGASWTWGFAPTGAAWPRFGPSPAR